VATARFKPAVTRILCAGTVMLFDKWSFILFNAQLSVAGCSHHRADWLYKSGNMSCFNALPRNSRWLFRLFCGQLLQLPDIQLLVAKSWTITLETGDVESKQSSQGASAFLRSRRHDLAPQKGAAGYLRNNRSGNMTSSRQSVGNWKCKAVLCR
jgi:hypothetical protein